jgi:DeoR/GlpR family transcriptional regulator of sugar metabolism
MALATNQRRQRILSELLEHKHVTIRGLASDMGLSEATVRRDLKAMADEAQLTLVHGGATLPRNGDYSIQAKRLRQVEEKTIIGRLAADLVRDGDQVFLDSGTTCGAMAPDLRRRRGVTVVTNSLRLTGELDGLGVILLGGQYRADRMDAVGPITLSTLEQLRGFAAFIGADGLSMDFGPSAADIDSAHLHRLVIQHAREATLLADHTKFASPSLFRIVEWDRISRLVTDRMPDQAWRDFLDQRGIELICPQLLEQHNRCEESPE